MRTKTIYQPELAIPRGMSRLQPDQSNAFQGGKRREGAFLNRAVYGMLAGMIVPGGFIISFF